MRTQLLTLLQLAGLAAAWMPRDRNYFKRDENTLTDGLRSFKNRRQIAPQEIRGVNLGGLFIVEPWMASTAWNTIGCADQKSEFDCVVKLGQERANQAFADHWSTWITASDLDLMKSYGLNTIRVPIGYWIKEDVVYKDSEHFPQGALTHLETLCGWASDRNMYIILDLHGAPGAQDKQQAFTGQYSQSAGFYVDWQYQRAYDVLHWLTNIVHTNSAFRGVGSIEVLNEPQQDGGASTLTSHYYPGAMNAIRSAESALGIQPANGLHVMMMDGKWGAGDPNSNMKNQLTNAAYDNHRYIKWDSSVAATPEAYLRASCHDNVSGNWPLVVGEWSLSVGDSVQWSAAFDLNAQKQWYKRWWAAQVMAYEKQDGWVFWNWKAELGDYRWSYKDAVAAGVISKNPGDAFTMGACNGI